MAIVAELAWKSVLCAGFALLLLRVLRSRSASEKAMAANLALLALLSLPIGLVALPEFEFAAPEAISAAFPDAGGTLTLASELEPGALSGAAPAPGEPAATSWQEIALGIYLVPGFLLLLGLLLGVVRLQRMRARADVIVDARWLAALANAQRRLGFKHGTALLISSELNSPVSWGVVRPIIIVDPRAASDTERAEAIIAHELAHVVRLDWLKLLIGRLAICLFWFNPLVWMLARQSHQLCEEAADDAVLRAEIPDVDYADVLLGAVRHSNNAVLLPANGVAPSRSSLGRRITHVLDASRPRAAATMRWAAASLGLMLGLNVALAVASPTLAQSRIESFGSSTSERAADDLERLASRHAQTLGRAIRSGDWAARRVQGRTSFDEPAAIAPLLQALRDDQAAVRRIAVWGLSEMRPTVGEVAAGPVSDLMSDPAPEVRAQAARALGDFGSVEWAQQIAALLRDRVPEVRRQAAHALGDLRDPRTRAALEATLDDPDAAVKAKVAWAIKQVEEAETVLQRYGNRSN
jgi:beta-lactamase regulating signal transducer with metallopeptidase domain